MFPWSISMLRRAFAPKSLERYFLLLAVGVLLLVTVLTGTVLWQNWKTYTSSSEARDAFAVIRATVKVMELASAERGPMNAALGADLPVPESNLAALRAARGRTDAQIDQLLALYAAPLNPEKLDARAEIQRIRHALSLARIHADLVITTPRDRLTGDDVWAVVSAMVRLCLLYTSPSPRD